MSTLPLPDADYGRFLDQGYLVLAPSSLDAAAHHQLYERANELYAMADAGVPDAHLSILGDNLRAQIPAIDAVLNDPTVAGALERVLGPDPLLHPHSYCHRSSDLDQVFHQDGNLPWNERGHYRSHVGDWAMLFYYPQTVDTANGPTEVVVGSQYWTIDHETPERWHRGDRIDRSVTPEEMSDPDHSARDDRLDLALANGFGIPGLERRFITVPAGSVVLAHYDLVHRGSRTDGANAPRYLYKFYFARVHRPPAPAPSPPPAPQVAIDDPRAAVIRAAWRWSHGATPVAPDSIPASTSSLAGLDREDERVAAAYALAEAGSVPGLAQGLHGPTEGGRRAASHALRAMGSAGRPTLLDALHSPAAPVRRAAAAGLASHHAAGGDTVEALIRAASTDTDDLVRSLAAYALGLVARGDDVDGTAIGEALAAQLVPGAEPDNAHGAGFSRSTVRQSAALALVLTLANQPVSSDLAATVVDLALGEDDRYVRGLLVEAAIRSADVESADLRRLLAGVAARRWSPPPPARSNAT